MFQTMMSFLGNSSFSETYFDYMKMQSEDIVDRVRYLEKYYKERNNSKNLNENNIY